MACNARHPNSLETALQTNQLTLIAMNEQKDGEQTSCKGRAINRAQSVYFSTRPHIQYRADWTEQPIGVSISSTTGTSLSYIILSQTTSPCGLQEKTNTDQVELEAKRT